MRVVSFSDLHLGFRAFSATEGGRNARECDVERAWAQVVENTIAADPDLMLCGGDVVHHPRVSGHAVKAWRDGVRRLVTETAAPIVVVQGNHDAARTSEVLSPILIPDDYDRVHIVLEPRRVQLELDRTGERVAVACYPYVARGTDESYRVAPDEAADLNVMLLHAAVSGDAEGDRLPHFYGGAGALDVGREAERWDLIVCGDYHEFTRLHPSRPVFYPGAIERTSSNIWVESQEKGIVVYDTADGSLEFVEHETRQVRDLHWGPPTASAVNQALSVLLEGGEPDGVIVRAVIDEFPRSERDQIDWSLVRKLKQRALHFSLDLRWASRSATHRPTSVSPDGTGRPLLDQAREFFSDSKPDVRSLALGYMGLEDDPETEQRLLPPGDRLLVCPNCGNLDSVPQDWTAEQPCSAGCGATMMEQSATPAEAIA